VGYYGRRFIGDMRTPHCEHFGVDNQVLEIYPAPLNIDVFTSLNSQGVVELKLQAAVIQLKVKCQVCGLVWLDEMTFEAAPAEQ
jgi:hypothetical protein